MKRYLALFLIVTCIFVVGCESRAERTEKEALALLAAPLPAEYTQNERAVIAESNAVTLEAEKLFDVDLDMVIRFGELDGVATAYKITRDGETSYLLGFNSDVVRTNLKAVTTKAVPHEIAHFVAWAKGVPKSHSGSWRSYCRQLAKSKEFCSESIKA